MCSFCQDCLVQSHSPIYPLLICLSTHSSSNNGILSSPMKQWSSGRKPIDYKYESANVVIEESTIFCGHQENTNLSSAAFSVVLIRHLQSQKLMKEIKCLSGVWVDSQDRQNWVQIPALLVTDCVILGKGFLRFSALSINVLEMISTS